jgi:hypothetical protein
MASSYVKTQSNIPPDDLSVTKIKGVYEILRAKNIKETTRETEEGYESVFEYDLIIRNADIKSRNQAVGIFVELEYSKDDEMSLINKGILDSQDPDYVKYREYVAWCKEQANILFEGLEQ